MNGGDSNINERYTANFMREIQILLDNMLTLRENISILIEVKDMTVSMKLPSSMLENLVRTVSELHRSFCEMERGMERMVVSFKLACPIIFHGTKNIENLIQNSTHVKKMLRNAQEKVGEIEKKEIVLRNQAKWNAWQKILVSVALRNFHRNRWSLYITDMKAHRKKLSLSDYISNLKTRNFVSARIEDLDCEPESFLSIKDDQFQTNYKDWANLSVSKDIQTDLTANKEGMYSDKIGVTYNLKQVKPLETHSLWTEEWKYSQCILVRLNIPPSDYSISIMVDDISHVLEKDASDYRNVAFPFCMLQNVGQIKVSFKRKDKVVLLGIIPYSMLNILHLSDVICSVLPDVCLTTESVELEQAFGNFSGLDKLDHNSVRIRLHSVDDKRPDIESFEFSLGRLWFRVPDSVSKATMTGDVELRKSTICVSTEPDLLRIKEKAVSTDLSDSLPRGNSQIYSREDYHVMREQYESEKVLLTKKYEDKIELLESLLSLKSSKDFKVEISEKTTRKKKFSSSAQIKENVIKPDKNRVKSAFSKRELYDLGKPSVKPFQQKKWCLAGEVVENQKLTRYSALVHPHFYPMSYWNKTRENNPPSMLNLPPVYKAKGIGITNIYNTCIKIKQK